MLCCYLLINTFVLPLSAQKGEPETSQQISPEPKKIEPAKPKTTETPTLQTTFEGTMTIDLMDEIIKRLDKDAKPLKKGSWQFSIEKVKVIVVTDEKRDRMRILVPIRQASSLSSEELFRAMQANFDTALDSRYALAKGILWSTYIHPLRALHHKQFISAIGQTVNAAITYGTTYTSGVLTFGGGDSRGIIQRKLIENLLKKGQEI